MHMADYRLKRPLDLALVVVAAPLWLPVLAILAVIVRVGMGRGVLFRQQRLGLYERPFEILKFRTMLDKRVQDGRALSDAERLTSFGRFLRASSLDELPELFNVLRGEMSLVGPRPLLPRYLERYSVHHRRRHEARPGMTGLAQVSGRNALSWDDRLDLDVAYVDSCSLSGDLRILVQTGLAVLGRRGISAPGDATMPEFTGSRTRTDAR